MYPFATSCFKRYEAIHRDHAKMVSFFIFTQLFEFFFNGQDLNWCITILVYYNTLFLIAINFYSYKNDWPAFVFTFIKPPAHLHTECFFFFVSSRGVLVIK